MPIDSDHGKRFVKVQSMAVADHNRAGAIGFLD